VQVVKVEQRDAWERRAAEERSADHGRSRRDVTHA